MRTVKQVSDLTRVSVRTLHYYDEIGLLKPSEVTTSGYRFYDDEALETLQQILFFKELELPLKEVKEIMANPNFEKRKALENQKKLLTLKRNRLDKLIELINKSLEGDNEMSFKEFDMSEYYNALEEYKKEHEDKVIKHYGSIEKYNEFIEKCKAKEAEIAEMAIKEYGSIEKYVKAMKQNLNSDVLTFAEEIDNFKKDLLEDNHPKLKELFKNLTADLNKAPSAGEVQQIAEQITNTVKEDYEIYKSELGDDYWYSFVRLYLIFPDWIKAIDEKYGVGASKFIGEALKYYIGEDKPKLNILYEKLTSDLSKAPSSKEIQDIVKEIVLETKKQNEALGVDQGEKHWSYMADCYLTNSSWIKVAEKNYGTGSAKFLGEAFKFYSEN